MLKNVTILALLMCAVFAQNTTSNSTNDTATTQVYIGDDCQMDNNKCSQLGSTYCCIHSKIELLGQVSESYECGLDPDQITTSGIDDVATDLVDDLFGSGYEYGCTNAYGLVTSFITLALSAVAVL